MAQDGQWSRLGSRFWKMIEKIMNINNLYNIMKRTFMKIAGACVFGAAMLAGLVSCDKNEESFLGTLKVTVTAPADYDQVDLASVTVAVQNAGDQSVTSLVADVQGVAEFTSMVAGSYNVSASVNVGELKFNAVQTGVVVASKQTTEITLALEAAGSSENLVIKEIFYSGEDYTYDVAGATMMKDFFIEIFNNSDSPVSLDGLYVGDAWTPATSDDVASAPELSILEDNTLDHDYVYLNAVVRIPTDAGIALQPGKSFVLAVNAINFKEELRSAAELYEMEVDASAYDHIIDLSKADMETYSVAWKQAQGLDGNEYFDLDNPDVPNAENIFLTNDYFFWDMTGAAPVIFRNDTEFTASDVVTYTYTPGGSSEASEIQLLKVSTKCIVDGADFVSNAESSRWKRLPSYIDKGFSYIPNDWGSLTGYSQRRKIDETATAAVGRLVLQDTNNTGSDFEAVEPAAPKGGYTGYEL